MRHASSKETIVGERRPYLTSHQGQRIKTPKEGARGAASRWRHGNQVHLESTLCSIEKWILCSLERRKQSADSKGVMDRFDGWRLIGRCARWCTNVFDFAGNVGKGELQCSQSNVAARWRTCRASVAGQGPIFDRVGRG